jgi:hypothetical protein
MGQKITKLKPLGGFGAEERRSHHSVRHCSGRHSGQHHSHHYGRDRWRGRGASFVRRAAGSCSTHRVGLDPYDSRLGRCGRGDFPAHPLHLSARLTNPYHPEQSDGCAVDRASAYVFRFTVDHVGADAFVRCLSGASAPDECVRGYVMFGLRRGNSGCSVKAGVASQQGAGDDRLLARVGGDLRRRTFFFAQRIVRGSGGIDKRAVAHLREH